MKSTLILVQCKDAIGLVTSISQVLASHGLNIIAMREFVDELSSSFFARIEFRGEVSDDVLLYKELEDSLPENALIKINPSTKKKIAVLVTKEYHCLGDI